VHLVVLTPRQAAERLGGISVETLARLVLGGRHAYTELSPGARPGRRGRGVWGLTEAQLADLVAAQARRVGDPSDRAEPGPARRAGSSIPGHDGKSRIAARTRK
jgi:hypothetical protein